MQRVSHVPQGQYPAVLPGTRLHPGGRPESGWEVIQLETVRIKNKKTGFMMSAALPTTKTVLEDILELLGTDDPEQYAVRIEPRADEDSMQYLYMELDGARLDEVNCLITLWEQMNQAEHLLFRNAVWLYPDAKIENLINAAYNLDNMKLLEGVYDGDQLKEYLSANKIKAKIAGKGEFGRDGYCYPIQKFREVYTGRHLPAEAEDYVFRVEIYCSNELAVLNLPTEQENIAAVQRHLLEDQDCHIAAVQSAHPVLQQIEIELCSIDILNELTRDFTEMPDARTRQKFLAALQLEGCSDLYDALKISKNLQCYDYAATAEEIGKEYFRTHVQADMDHLCSRYMDWQGFGKEIAAENYKEFENGYIRRNENQTSLDVIETAGEQAGITMEI